MDVMNELSSTAYLFGEFMSANNITVKQLAEASGVSVRTIYRVLNDESKLNSKVAFGLNRLLPDVSPSFLMKYDAGYQTQRAAGRAIERKPASRKTSVTLKSTGSSKSVISIRIDNSTLQWLKSTGSNGYQKRANEALEWARNNGYKFH